MESGNGESTNFIRKEQVSVTLQKRLSLLNEAKRKLEEELRNVPSGTLNVIRRGNRTQFYHYQTQLGEQKDANYRGTYIRKDNMKLVEVLAQKDYASRLKRDIENEIRAIEDCLNRIRIFEKDALTDYYSSLNAVRKLLVTPVILPDDEYIEKWKSVVYEGKGFLDSGPEHYTDLGERVRSKSEVMIGNALARAGIPYRYEYPVNLKGFGTVYPDFYCLKIRTREEVAWEHMGCLNDEEYREHALDKINRYEINGYTLGKRLIISHETAEHPLNMKVIERKIREYLM